MSIKLHEWIRERIESDTSLTQKGLADRMGLNPAAVNRMLYGNRKIMADEISIIEGYLGQKYIKDPEGLIYEQYPKDRNKLYGFSDGNIDNQSPFCPDNLVPVYKTEIDDDQNHILLKDNIADWVPRHPFQQGIIQAFAIYVYNNKMEPRYFNGELIYIHPGRPLKNNHDCLIELNSGNIQINRIISESDYEISIQEFNPNKVYSINKSEIKSIYPIIGRN